MGKIGAAAMLLELWDNWVLLGLLAAGGWAMSSVLDVCFVSEGIYGDPIDGPVIAGLFFFLPAVAAARSLGSADIDWAYAGLAMLSAGCYLLHVYFYFRGLFELNDASNAEIFNTLSVLLVPLLAFLFLDEQVASMDYAAIVVAGAGVLILVMLQSARISRRTIGFLSASVVFISVSMVLQARALEVADYNVAAGVFSITAFVLASVGLAFLKTRRRHLIRMCRRFGYAFVLVQLLELGAVFGSQRATDVGPSVSLVALLESALPVFIMLFSWVFVVVSRRWRMTGAIEIRRALASQITAAPSKLTALAMITAAIALVQA